MPRQQMRSISVNVRLNDRTAIRLADRPGDGSGSSPTEPLPDSANTSQSVPYSHARVDFSSHTNLNVRGIVPNVAGMSHGGGNPFYEPYGVYAVADSHSNLAGNAQADIWMGGEGNVREVDAAIRPDVRASGRADGHEGPQTDFRGQTQADVQRNVPIVREAVDRAARGEDAHAGRATDGTAFRHHILAALSCMPYLGSGDLYSDGHAVQSKKRACTVRMEDPSGKRRAY